MTIQRVNAADTLIAIVRGQLPATSSVMSCAFLPPFANRPWRGISNPTVTHRPTAPQTTLAQPVQTETALGSQINTTTGVTNDTNPGMITGRGMRLR